MAISLPTIGLGTYSLRGSEGAKAVASAIADGYRLIDTADVLVENFRPGKLEALGFVPDELIARNPRLVITRVSGFGQAAGQQTLPHG